MSSEGFTPMSSTLTFSKDANAEHTLGTGEEIGTEFPATNVAFPLPASAVSILQEVIRLFSRLRVGFLFLRLLGRDYKTPGVKSASLFHSTSFALCLFPEEIWDNRTPHLLFPFFSIRLLLMKSLTSIVI
jgi:hypothetical protein